MDIKEEKALGNFTMSDKPTANDKDKKNDTGKTNDAYEEEETVLELPAITLKVNGRDSKDRRKVSYASDTSGGDNSRKMSHDFHHVNLTSIPDDEEEESGSGLMYTISQNPPFHLMLLFGFQQALLSLSASLATVIIAAGVICADADEEFKAQMMCSTLLMNGVATLMMNTIGSRLPLFQGAYAGYIIPLITLTMIDPGRCDPGRYGIGNYTLGNMTTPAMTPVYTDAEKREVTLILFRQVQGCLMIVGAIHCLIGATGMVGVLLRFIGPITIVPTILLLVIYAAEPILTFCVPNWGICFFTAGLGFILAFYLARYNMPIPVWTKQKGFHIIKYPLHQVYSMLLSIIIGWLVSLIITEAGGFTDDPTAKEYNSRTDARLDAIANSKWFFFPYPGMYGMPTFNSGVFVGFLIATLISILDSIGDYYAVAEICRVPPPPAFAVNRGIAVEGLATIFSGMFGAPQATTTYGANIGAIGISKVASRSTLITCAFIYIIFGVVGKVSGVFITIPYPVLGGTFLVMLGIVAGVVISMLKQVDLTSTRNLAVIGSSLMVGLIIPLWVKKYPGDIDTGDADVDFIIKSFLGNPNFVGTVIACFLDNTIPGTLESRGIAAWQDAPSSAAIRSNPYYEEGMELYEFWLPKAVKRWKGWQYVPFMPYSQSRRKSRTLSVSGSASQLARRKSLFSAVPDTF